MAYRKGGWRGRARNYGRRAYGYGKRMYGRTGLNMTMPFLAGTIVGLTDFDKVIPAEIKLGVAVLPVKGVGSIKGFAQGLIAGDLIQGMTGINLFKSPANGNGSGSGAF